MTPEVNKTEKRSHPKREKEADLFFLSLFVGIGTLPQTLRNTYANHMEFITCLIFNDFSTITRRWHLPHRINCRICHLRCRIG